MPPTEHNRTYLGIGADGRNEFRFRQSTLKTLDTCPARVRYEEDHPDQCWESDAAAIGTAVHAGIEAYLTGECESLRGMLMHMEASFLSAVEGDTFKWIKWSGGAQSLGAAIGFGTTCLGFWWEKYNERFAEGIDLGSLLIEKHFDLPFYEDDERVIRLSGTMDLVDWWANADEHSVWNVVTPWDWKTAGREYVEWEYKRWAVQPTAYTWACKQLWPNDEIGDFTYSVMGSKGIQQFSVERGPQDWKFLETKVVNYAKMIEKEVWPTQDNHALCSEKWCPNFSGCKGASC